MGQTQTRGSQAIISFKVSYFFWRYGKWSDARPSLPEPPEPAPEPVSQMAACHRGTLGQVSCPGATGCPENPKKGRRILRPQEDPCPPFAEAIDSWIRSVELEERIFKFPLVEEPKMGQSTSVPPNWTFKHVLGKMDRFLCVGANSMGAVW